jgi:glutathione synthase/RimK-type ligase-like ATP-grasp enzyme
MTPRYLVLANADSKRWQAYAHDLARFWQERGIQPDVHLVAWREVVPCLGDIDAMPVFDAPAVVRLESPGRDIEVMKLLLQAGAAADPREPPGDWLGLPYCQGQMVRPRLFHDGFRRTLQGLQSALESRPHLTPLACPLAVAELFDKSATAARLTAAGLPCPPSLPTPASPQELLDSLHRHGFNTAYVKLNTGSAAMGIAVVHACDDPPWAITSLLRRTDGFYNTRRLQRVTGAELTAVLEFLIGEGVIIQKGIPMAQIDGENFDVRVVVLYGRPAFTIFRLSGEPMTNLHLGGRRGRLDVCRAHIPTRAWLDALDHCAEAAGLYDCAYVGVDLLFERGYLRHYILEMNAFGDFFPGLTDPDGRSVHRAEIEDTARRVGYITRDHVTRVSQARS